jgi:hypothetical protein
MDLSVIATIVILAILTIIIFAFAFVVFKQIHVTEKAMVAQGNRDEEIIKDREQSKKKSYKILNIISNVFSSVIAFLAVGFMAFAIYVHSQGDLFFIGGHSSMVVASDSMSKVYDSTEQTYLTDDMITEEFSRGDIVVLSDLPSEDQIVPDINVRDTDGTVSSPYRYNVFVYRSKIGTNAGKNIIHRLVSVHTRTNEETGEVEPTFRFRGDANGGVDTETVTFDQLKALYPSNNKVEKAGYFILFFESVFGMYAVISSVIMIILSTTYTAKIQKDYDVRWNELEHHHLVIYDEIHDIHVKVQAGWANERYELRQKIGELKERSAENHEEIKNKVEEHHEEIKAKVEQHHEEVKAHIEEKKTPVVPAAPVTPEPAPVKPVEKPAPVAEPKPAPKVEEPKPQPKPVEAPKPQPKPEEPKPMPKKVFGKHGVYVKIVKSDDDPLDESKPSGVAIKK